MKGCLKNGGGGVARDPTYSQSTLMRVQRRRILQEGGLNLEVFQRSDLGGPPAFEDLCVQRAREDLLRPFFLHYTPMRLREAALLQ